MVQSQQPSPNFPGIPRILEHIAACARKCGRDLQSIRLVAVTKTQMAPVLSALMNHGIRDYGENRVEHLQEMVLTKPPGSTFHYIGRIQRRQYGKVLQHCQVLHSFCRSGPFTRPAARSRRTSALTWRRTLSSGGGLLPGKCWD